MAKASASTYYEKNIEKVRQKSRDLMRKKRLENPEYAAEVANRYRENHPERALESRKRYYANNRAELRAKNSEWHKQNPEYEKARAIRRMIESPSRCSDYYKKNKDWMTLRAKMWRKENPQKAREISRKNNHRRRADKSASVEHYTLSEIRELKKKTGNKCAMCKCRGPMTIDHITPLAKGGSNAIRNIQFLCKSCNSTKQDLDPIEFARKKGMLL